MALRPINGLALCAGIGGLELGISLAVPGYRSVCFVEREAPAAALLVAAMQNGIVDEAPVWSDLATFDGRRWRGVVDLVSAGYPCQPFSVAGKRLGEADERHLWPHVARIVGEVEPVLVFLENVPGHLQLGFERVVADLRGMGYSVAAGLFTAAEVGAPHRRERLFILGRLADAERASVQQAPTGRAGDAGGIASPGSGRIVVAHAHGQERRERDGEPRNQPAESGEGLGTPPLPVLRQEPSAGTGLAGDSGAGGLGDSCNQRLPQRPEPEVGRGDLWEEGSPAWPPGPADDWTGIDPRLWPAVGDSAGSGLQAGRRPAEQSCRDADSAGAEADGPEAPESPIRLLADGPPSRIDLLRALGNAVVPAVAAKAFTTLAGVLMPTQMQMEMGSHSSAGGCE